jgi:molybdate transport system ATP-binding protein
MHEVRGEQTLPKSEPVPHHRLRVDARVGALHIRSSFALAAQWTVLFGSSGSGKSTILRAAAGLLRHGAIEFSRYEPTESAWIDVQTQHRSTPPHMRSIAYAPQGSVLFPHLTVEENVAFAGVVRGAASQQLVGEALELFELSPLASRYARDLSGGERQRVNLARAFAVPKPTLFLLDEPFTGLDRAIRDRLLECIRKGVAASAVPVLSVTHDVEEALLLGAEVIRIDDGRVVARGPAEEALSAERTSMLQALQSKA